MKNIESQEDIIETVESPETQQPRPGGELKPRKGGWFFPNQGEGSPFGIEAETYEEALEANRRHLEEEKKEKH